MSLLYNFSPDSTQYNYDCFPILSISILFLLLSHFFFFFHFFMGADVYGLDFARPDYEGPQLKDLLEIIEYVRPTALLGLSTISVSWSCFLASSACLKRSDFFKFQIQGAFTPAVIKAMAEISRVVGNETDATTYEASHLHGW